MRLSWEDSISTFDICLECAMSPAVPAWQVSGRPPFPAIIITVWWKYVIFTTVAQIISSTRFDPLSLLIKLGPKEPFQKVLIHYLLLAYD